MLCRVVSAVGRWDIVNKFYCAVSATNTSIGSAKKNFRWSEKIPTHHGFKVVDFFCQRCSDVTGPAAAACDAPAAAARDSPAAAARDAPAALAANEAPPATIRNVPAALPVSKGGGWLDLKITTISFVLKGSSHQPSPEA